VDNKTKKLFQSYILDYLKLHIPDFKITGKGGKDMFTCPLHHDHPNDTVSANLFPENSYNVYCFHPDHRKLGDIFSMVRRLEPSMGELNDDDIGKYLEKLFDIKTDERVEKLLAEYHSMGWSLVPIAKGDKKANVEKEWQRKIHKNPQEWKDWIGAGLNIGVNCGLSNVLIIDIDAMPSDLKKKWYAGTITDEEKGQAIKIKTENLKKVLEVLGNPKTLSQNSLGGVHLFFQQEEEIPKTWVDIEGVHVDIETREGQVLIEPSIVFGQGRQMNDGEITKLPDELKKLILSRMKTSKKTVDVPTLDADISVKGLDGECNSTFVKLGGMLRKKLNVPQTEYALQLINQNLLDDPMESKAVRSMCRSIEKYHEIDMEDLANKVIERLEKVEEATIRDLTYSLRQEQKDIEDVLRHLVDADRIYKKGLRYKLFAKANWQTEFVDASKLLDFKVPYLEDYAVCRNGDMIVIGGKTGEGKSHIALNIVKKLKDQGIVTNYISSEPGNRFAKIAMTLGLKEGDLKWCNHYRPEQVELEDNAVTIIDWLLPENYAETDKLYSKFAQQLDKHGGLLIIFTQLRKTGEFFAKDMIDFFASVNCTYNQTSYSDKGGNITYDSENTYFLTSKIRESRTGRQIIKIPTVYDKATKTLELRRE